MPDSAPPESRAALAVPPVPLALPPRRRRGLRVVLLLLGPLVLIAAGGYFYLSGGRYVSTDNAYVQADTLTVSADVDGRVAEILVRDNQQVAAGDLLYRLDPAPFEIALRRAQAQVEQVRIDTEGQVAALGEARARLAAVQETVAFAQRELDRQQQLSQRGAASQASLDEAQHTLTQAQQTEAAGQQEIARLLVALGGDAATPIESLPVFQAAVAARDAAALDLEHASVHAPVAGIVTNVSQLERGEYLSAGSPAFTLVETEAVWVEANLKETDLTHVLPGQVVEVTVDTYPDRFWRGTIDSISPATGAEFSLLPAQNATGNWVKVVQRVPVRLTLEAVADGPVLRAGMSANVSIDTGHQRQLPGFVGSAFGLTRADDAASPAGAP